MNGDRTRLRNARREALVATGAGGVILTSPVPSVDGATQPKRTSSSRASWLSHGAVSILIVNWNTRDLTLACLGSFANAPSGTPYEVIVVDNGSVDRSAEAFSQQPGIELLCNDLNLGFAAAVNQAFRRSHGDYVLLLNSDVTLAPDALSVLARFLDERESVAGVGPVYVNPDGTPQPFHFRFPTFATTLANGSSLLRRLVPGSGSAFASTRCLTMISRVHDPCLSLRQAACCYGDPCSRANTSWTSATRSTLTTSS